jgi:hypothetical protein
MHFGEAYSSVTPDETQVERAKTGMGVAIGSTSGLKLAFLVVVSGTALAVPFRAWKNTGFSP